MTTVVEFNALLTEIIALAAAEFCRARDREGQSVEQVNIELADHLAMLERWRATTLAEFEALNRNCTARSTRDVQQRQG